MSQLRRALVTGATQGVGLVLARWLAVAGWQLVLTSRREEVVTAVAAELSANTRVIPCPGDIANPAYRWQLDTAVAALGGLDLVIHCAAYTDVDGCARDPQRAYRINALGTQNVTLACLEFGAEMVHISTNEVFAGDCPAGYEEWMPLNPVNAYGRSRPQPSFMCVTTSATFTLCVPPGCMHKMGRNFIHAILRQARQNGRLHVVADEVGSPTAAADLAAAILQLVAARQFGVYHFVKT
ncbi:MAG: SDR family NAD(P)-dependent oxidoreductase [Ardenticatenaceae bacterium]|nr:SDR family NAD(P)-dependent oxidoreductase [Ardenticatenaceae bacterium]